MKLIEEALIEQYGERCPDFSEGCPCCEAWAEFDTLTRPAAPVNGLERLSMQYIGWEDKAVCIAPDEKGDYCLVTQAERIIINERLEVRKSTIEQVKWMKKALTLQADNDALIKKNQELEAAWLKAEALLSEAGK